MVLIGVDPHKATHTAVAIDASEEPIARVTVGADRRQVQRLLEWAEPLGDERVWAVESASRRCSDVTQAGGQVDGSADVVIASLDGWRKRHLLPSR